MFWVIERILVDRNCLQARELQEAWLFGLENGFITLIYIYIYLDIIICYRFYSGYIDINVYCVCFFV